jgi:SAM-dependent methyltransferase
MNTASPTNRQEEREHFRLLYKVSLIKSLCKKYHVSGLLVDVGCRHCDYIEALEPVFEGRLGVDLQRIFIEARKSMFDVVNAAGENLPIKTDSCGIVLLLETVEHVSNPARVLDEIRAVLDQSGYLFLTAPNRFYPFEIHGMRIRKRTISLRYGVPFLSWAPNLLRRHLQRARIYTQKELVSLCEEQGFKVVEIEYMPPQFDVIGNGAVTNSVRIVANKLGRWAPMKQMGVSCIIFARKA